MIGCTIGVKVISDMGILTLVCKTVNEGLNFSDKVDEQRPTFQIFF